MSLLSTRIEAALLDYDAQISRIEADAKAQVDVLKAKQAILREARAAVTDELEALYASLADIGLINAV